jgi:hypothetical protein
MAERKPVFIQTEGYHEEMAATDSMTLGGLTMGGNIAMGTNAITGLLDPLLPQDAATKAYVDSVAQGLDVHPPCDALAVANIAALSGLTTVVDTVPLNTDGMRVLLTGQSGGGIANGIYVVHTGAWTRAADMPIGEHAAGSFAFIHTVVGSLYGGTGWVCTNDNPTDVVGTDGLTFGQFSGAGTYSAGAGLSLTGTQFSVKKGDGIEVTSNGAATNIDLAVNPGLALTGTSPNKKLSALVSANGGIQIDSSNGLALLLNGTTLLTGALGVSVKGLPASFEVAGVATHSATPGTGQVTAANLDTLTAGSSSNADSLHSHSVAAAPYAGRVELSMAVAEAITAGDPVYQTATNDQIGRGDAGNDSKSRVIGVARTGQITVGNPVPIVEVGPCVGVLTGATANTPYYLANGGGLTTTPPGGGKRFILMGFAKNATDLHVRITDYGKKA